MVQRTSDACIRCIVNQNQTSTDCIQCHGEGANLGHVFTIVGIVAGCIVGGGILLCLFLFACSEMWSRINLTTAVKDENNKKSIESFISSHIEKDTDDLDAFRQYVTYLNQHKYKGVQSITVFSQIRKNMYAV